MQNPPTTVLPLLGVGSRALYVYDLFAVLIVLYHILLLLIHLGDKCSIYYTQKTKD